MSKVFSPKLDRSWYEARTLLDDLLRRATRPPSAVLLADLNEGLQARAIERQRKSIYARESERRASE